MCTGLTASEIKVMELKKKPLMVYRCSQCPAAGKSDFISDLNNSIGNIESSLTEIKEDINQLKAIKKHVKKNKDDISYLKLEMNKIAPLECKVSSIENKINHCDPALITAECQAE